VEFDNSEVLMAIKIISLDNNAPSSVVTISPNKNEMQVEGKLYKIFF
jgi:hypothetical protein